MQLVRVIRIKYPYQPALGITATLHECTYDKQKENIPPTPQKIMSPDYELMWIDHYFQHGTLWFYYWTP